VDNPLETLHCLQGGLRLFAKSQLDAIKEALFEFQQKTDTKAAIMMPMAYTSGQVCHCPVKAKIGTN